MLAALCVLAALAPRAHAETRSLKLYYLHTKEKATIAYKRDGRYLQSGLDKINWFLRDWRRDEPTKMDPQLLDLIWEVYQKSGSRDYIHVISAYRSPATNNMLRRRGRGVARNSQHTLGKAMDFFLPDVKLSKLRAIGLQQQVGGVGFYPGSGSPFVHLDTGSVRHWPRMNRQQLARVFPNGQTLHVPSDGKPLPGYEVAKARYEARKASASKIQIASGADEKKPSRGLIGRLFARNQDKDETETGAENTEQQVAAATPAPQAEAEPVQAVASAATEALIPTTIPVPTLAPREQQGGTLLAIADETLPEEQVAALTPTDEALPVPAPNPLAQAQTVTPVIQSEQTVLAGLPGERVEMETWTADEIADLRRTAVPVKSPRPVIGVGATRPSTTALALAEPADTGLQAAQQALNIAVAEPAPETVALATSVPETATLAAPQPRPARAGPSQSTLELALAANRQSSRASEAIRELINATELAEERKQEAPLTTIALSGIPIPQPSPLKAAARRTAVTLASTDRFETLNAVGKWALRGDRGMNATVELQPPAYGVNAVSTAGQAVASDGFVATTPAYNPDRLFLSAVSIDRFTTATIIRN